MRLPTGLIGAIILSSGTLAGCASSGSMLQPSAATAARRSAIPPSATGARNLVYVSDQLQKAVLGFPASERAMNPAPAETLSLHVITEGVWVDRAGILYVALSPQDPSQFGKVEEFKPGATSPFRTITDGIGSPSFLVVDQKGTLYVDQTYDLSVQILEYPASRTSPSVTLQITEKGEGIAGGMTLDAHRNLYVHTFFLDNPPSRVYRFEDGHTTPEDLQLNGLGDTSGLSGDKFGNLYVSDANAGISVYAPGQKSPSREILPPSNSYFDDFVATRSGELYVGQGESPSAASLLEYAPGGAQPVNVLSGHLQAPLVPALRAAAF